MEVNLLARLWNQIQSLLYQVQSMKRISLLTLSPYDKPLMGHQEGRHVSCPSNGKAYNEWLPQPKKNRQTNIWVATKGIHFCSRDQTRTDGSLVN